MLCRILAGWRILCINRNIVECKDVGAIVKSSLFPCINRNIVECKDYCLKNEWHYQNVLIETLWNVKESIGVYRLRTVGVLIETLWNVKLRQLSNILSVHWRVLIETLWNVKEEHKKRIRKQAIVLIETLWNVKHHHKPVNGGRYQY
mgnify:CR=1 FL=1